MNINIITLGCSKNLVDSEVLIRQFEASGHHVFHDDYEITADVVILNTCGFILDAKQESIEQVLHFIGEKKAGKVEKVFVMGCLSERYRDDLAREMPEVDGFFGVWDHQEIVKAVGAKFYGELLTDRSITTPSHYAFLKIAEGCNRSCAFCAIPGIRGKQRSRTIESLVEETEHLAGKGVKELILIAQDLTGYGTDLAGKKGLPLLLKELSAVEGIEWIRLHYAYPTGFPQEVMEIMANNPKVCRYLDIPIQHINSDILRAMNRGHDRELIEKLLKDFRKKVPGVALRTTLLTGFPGETDAQFKELLTFVEDARFERLGVFPYSHEEDTPAYALEETLSDHAKQDRASQVMAVQQQISESINASRVGQELKVIIDSEEPDHFLGRTEFDSPEVDNEVIIEKTKKLKVGEFYTVKITDSAEFDLFAKPV